MNHWTQAEVREYMKTGREPRRKRKPCPRLEVSLPIPPKATHPNARPHWAAKAKAVKKQREDAAVGARLALLDGGYEAPHWSAATVQITLYRASNRAKAIDPDNVLAWAKATIDGLADANLFINDRELTHLPPRQFIGKESGGRDGMVIVVEPSA